jgi:hypothetical protein
LATYILADFFINSSGHPGQSIPETDGVVLIGQMVGLVAGDGGLVVEAANDAGSADVVLKTPVGSFREKK